MDKCPKCGNKLSSIDVLCPKCGALVEVVQIRKGAGVHTSSSGMSVPVKKMPHQNLVVYNDDWPSDDTDITSLPEEESDVSAASPVPEEAIQPVNPLEAASARLESYAAEAELGSEEDYLAIFKNMKLPELDDIGAYNAPQHGFKPLDPPADVLDASTADSVPSDTSYERALPAYIAPADTRDEHAFTADIAPADNTHIQAIAAESASDDTEPESSAHHRWLEIEEFPAEAAAKAPESIPALVTAPAAVISDDTEYRYRYRSERRKADQAAPKRRGAGRTLLMALVWLLVAGALFCGFFFFDQYVTERYGSYPAMIYEWSDGNIDLSPSGQQ